MKKFLQNKSIQLALWLLEAVDEETKRQVLSKAVEHLFVSISVDDLLKENEDGTLRFEDKSLSHTYKKDLSEQAKILKSLLLWKVLKKDIQYQINRKMFVEGKVDLDFVWGQLLTFLWDIIEDRIDKISKFT